jgi:hypothetical protein
MAAIMLARPVVPAMTDGSANIEAARVADGDPFGDGRPEVEVERPGLDAGA